MRLLGWQCSESIKTCDAMRCKSAVMHLCCSGNGMHVVVLCVVFLQMLLQPQPTRTIFLKLQNENNTGKLIHGVVAVVVSL